MLDKYLCFDSDYDGEEGVNKEEVGNHLAHEEKAQELPSHASLSSKAQKKKRKAGASEQMVKKKKVKLFNEVDSAVSKCLDLEGNKEDDPELRGNRPDITMKDDQDPELVGILRTMNE